MHPGQTVPFTEAELAELTTYLDREIEEALYDHEDLLNSMSEWDNAYLAEPKTKKRTFPWPGAANIEIPVISNAVDSIVARMMNTIFAPDPFWTMKALSKEMDLVAKPLESQMDWSRKNEFDLYKACRSNFIELSKYGWSWYKVCWEVFTKGEYRINEFGVPIYSPRLIRRPNVYHILNRDVVVQAGMEDETQAEWVAHIIRLTDNQMWMRKEDGIYGFVDDVIKSKDDDPRTPENMGMREGMQSRSFDRKKTNTLYEIQLDWWWGEPRVPIPMVITFHRPSRKIVRGVFNPYGARFLKKAQFIMREGKLKGMGIAPRLYYLQQEIGTLHRQQVDNGTLANTRFFVGKKSVVRSGFQVWPGRVVPSNNPKEDLLPYAMGDIYPSSGILEMRALSYAERASAVSDYQLGRESSVAGSRATATGTLAIIQEGNRRFDLNIRDAREVLSDIGRTIILFNQMFRPQGMMYFVQGSGGMMTEQVLHLPPDFDVARLAVDVTASTATINRSVERQELMALMGVTERYYGGLAQLAMGIMNPQAPGEFRELLIREAKGGEHLMKKIVQSFDVKDVDVIVPGLTEDEQTEQAGIGGAPSGAPGGVADGRLAAMAQLYSQFTRGGARGNGGGEDVGGVS